MISYGMKDFSKINESVYYSLSDIGKIGPDQIDFLRTNVVNAASKRIRLCMHRNESDDLHEMIILLHKDTYIRPARHYPKVESLHVMEGRADAVFFDKMGRVVDVVELGQHGSGKVCFYRMNCSIYHTLLVYSEMFIFHESTTGPLYETETFFPDWAPSEVDEINVALYKNRIKEDVNEYKNNQKEIV